MIVGCGECLLQRFRFVRNDLVAVVGFGALIEVLMLLGVVWIEETTEPPAGSDLSLGILADIPSPGLLGVDGSLGV